MYNPVKTVGSKHNMSPRSEAILGCTFNCIEKVLKHEILEAVNRHSFQFALSQRVLHLQIIHLCLHPLLYNTELITLIN